MLRARAFQFVRHEHLALVRRQLLHRRLQFLQQHATGELRLGPRVGGGQQILQSQSFVAVRGEVARGHALGTAATEQVDDAVARHAEQPRAEGRRRHLVRSAVNQSPEARG